MLKKLNLFRSYAALILLLAAGLTGAYGGQAGQLTPAADSADRSDPSSAVEGNWFMEMQDLPERGQVLRRRGSLMRKRALKCVEAAGGGCRFYNKFSGADWILIHPRAGGLLMPQTGNFDLQWWGTGRSKLQQIGPNEIRGRWSYEGKGGVEIWRRALPQIKRAVFRVVDVRSEWKPGGAPGRVEIPGLEDRLRDPGLVWMFVVDVYGDNLWGRHLVDVGGTLDLKPLWESWSEHYIMNETGTYIMSGPSDNRQVLGIQIQVQILPKARPGKYALSVDGFSIPFELVIKGYPAKVVDEVPVTAPKVADLKSKDEPKIVERRLGRREQGRFVAYAKKQPMDYEKPFLIQVRFSSAPAYDATTVPLRNAYGERMEVPVYKTKSNPTIFESKTYQFRDPLACQGLKFCEE